MSEGRNHVAAEMTDPNGSSRPSVFLAYPFRQRDEWIRYVVPPLLNHFGCDVRTGELYPGREINRAVRDDIAQSNLLIAFLTRTQQLMNGGWVPSEWVLSEIGFAIGKEIPVLLIREEGVFTEIGILGNVQVISLDSETEAFTAFVTLRAAIRDLLFAGKHEDELAVCHLAKPGRRDRKNNQQWWDFWVWISGPHRSLDSIAEVKYKFPESFTPEEEEGDPRKAFGDYAETDAPITIKAKIRFKSGSRKTVHHKITVSAPGITPIRQDPPVRLAVTSVPSKPSLQNPNLD
jgi:hypothetical protein